MTEHDHIDDKQTKHQNRLKSKFESFKKLPHSISSNSAIQKARAFLRIFDVKHDYNITNEPLHLNCFSSTNSSQIHDNNQPTLNPIVYTSNISTPRTIKVDKINVYDNFSVDNVHEKHRRHIKPLLLYPKQYYNEIINKKPITTSTTIGRREKRISTSVSSINRGYTKKSNEIPENFSNCRPSIYNDFETSYDHEQSMLAWNRCVRRLNNEYRLTIDALEQVKTCLEKLYFDSAKQNITIERKKPTNVTFCLPSSTISSKENKTMPKVHFNKPKTTKPIQLETFCSSSKNENQYELDSIQTIIKKFNNLSDTLRNEKTLPKIKDQMNKTSKQNIDDSSLDEEEETTCTVETFYRYPDKSARSQTVDVYENSTKESLKIPEHVVNINIPNLTQPLNNNPSVVKFRLSDNEFPNTKNHVRSIVAQINNATISSASKVNKRNSYPTSARSQTPLGNIKINSSKLQHRLI